MESERCCKFLLLDFGHPMNDNSINNIINSLENILALALACSRSPRPMNFGISILNSDFAIFESEAHLRRNYDSIIKKLSASLKTAKFNSRVTAQEYKCLLRSSMEGVFREFQKFLKANDICSQSTDSFVQIAVVTKKAASVLAYIILDVANRVQESLPNKLSVKNYKIIQILNKQENNSIPPEKDTLINCTFCLDNIHNLNCFFKEWLLDRQQELQILLMQDLNLEVHCDVEDCTVNPFLMFDGRVELLQDIWYKGSIGNLFLGIQGPPRQLEIINRFPVNGFCPTFVFGTPRRIFATRSCTLTWTECQANAKLFQQLCRELCRTGEGLLARSALPSATGEINSFHLLTSDGNMLLMNDVAPEELYLPSFRNSFSESSGDESAASLVRTCLEKIKQLDEYNPKRHSSGVYECLRNYLFQLGQRKAPFGHHDPSVKPFGKALVRKEQSKPTSDAKDCIVETSTAKTACETRKKRSRTASEVETENIHPALLLPNVVEKYRKIHSQAFNLPELSKDYNLT